MNSKPREIVCPCLQLRKADRNISRIFDSWLRPEGIRITQYGMLACVAKLAEPSISEIGKALSMDQTTVTRNIMKLESIGLVQSKQDPHNRQKKLVVLTDMGIDTLSKNSGAWEAARSYIREYLGEDDYIKLLALLDKLAEIPEK